MEQCMDFLNITIEEENKRLISRWLRIVDSAEFREGLVYIQSCIEKQNLNSWLFVAMHFAPPALMEQRWTVEHIVTLLEKTTLKKIALVLPDDGILYTVGNRMRKKIYHTFGQKILLECFSREDHALFWLNGAEATEAWYSL
jgi:hypothetical protein